MINILGNNKNSEVIANSPISDNDYQKAKGIILNIHKITAQKINEGYGPFYAEIYDENGKFVAGEANSVIKSGCSHNHAEINTIAKAEHVLNTYDVSKSNLTLYVNAEPCIMCVGAIMWSGVKTVYYSVPSRDVEKITGFDEGFKPNWQAEFSKRGIKVYGNIEPEAGKEVLRQYVELGKTVYKPAR